MNAKFSISRTSMAVLATLMVAWCPAHADDIIRSVDRDGRVVYSDHAPLDSRVVTRIPIERATADETRRSDERARTLAGAARAFDQRYAERVQRRDRAEADLRAAQTYAAFVRQQLAFSEPPLPGEVIGIRGGGTRLTEHYYARQAQILNELALTEVAIADARARFNDAR